MAQEAITNIRKHARAQRVHVLLTEQDGGYLVRIVDDGVGFTAPENAAVGPGGHLGVSAMRERVEMAGELVPTAKPGDGTPVEFWVPGVAPRPRSRRRAMTKMSLSSPRPRRPTRYR
jgi:signal transduction histidine kinase